MMILLLRCRRQTCKLIAITSLVWCLADIIFLLRYSDCQFSGICSRSEPNSISKRDSIKFAHRDKESVGDDVDNDKKDDILTKFPDDLLRPWTEAKIVNANTITGGKSSPGEMGVPVKIPPDKLEEKMEMFKINQFNLMASDMISLNRSLKDVRLTKCKEKVDLT